MVTVLLQDGPPREHKEADAFYFQEGILHVRKDGETVASYPQVFVVGVEAPEDCFPKG